MIRQSNVRPMGLLAAVSLVVVAACSSDAVTTATPTTTTVASPASTAAPATTLGTTTMTPVTTEAATATSSTIGTAPTTTTPTVGSLSRVAPPRELPAFADFTSVPLLDDTTPYAGPPTPRSLAQVLMTDYRREQVSASPELAAKLQQNGFVITDSSSRFFYDLYEQNFYNYETLFVTTDAVYNAWHLVFSKVLRDTEEQVLSPALGDFLTRMVNAARTQAADLGGTPSADAAARVVAYYEAAATLLGLDIGPISTMATDEVTLATEASAATTSPITGFQECQLPDKFQGCVDYTQFLPRGHYTHSEALKSYFRAMSVLGQEAFYVSDPASLRVGLLAARLVNADADATTLWKQIYDTTSFFVGVADDYTPVEVGEAEVVVGVTDPASFADDRKVAEIGARLTTARAISIDPENASVRMMGSRLVLDSYILDQLAWPNVGTVDDRRTRVSPLDVASAFGSPLAAKVQSDTDQQHFANYTTQLDAMRNLVAGRSASAWAGTVYYAWLYALQPQFANHGIAYPDFMQTDAWAAKALQTGLGSYTELKHDTILYAKQGTAAEGEGPTPAAFTPHHWVEPDPVAFGRLVALAQLTRDGLDRRQLLTSGNADLLDTFIELVGWLEGIAGDELAGKVTSESDNERLGMVGSELEFVWFLASDVDQESGLPPAPDDNAALVADIFRDSGNFLELGVGTPEEMMVLVPDGTGHFQLATGVVYSYYEFWRPAEALRLTDEEWRTLLINGAQPPQPSWVGPIRVGGSVADTPYVLQQL
jgi:hypothetical protein